VAKCIDTILKMTKGGGGKCLLVYPPSKGFFSAGDLIEPTKTMFEAIVPSIDTGVYNEILIFAGAHSGTQNIFHTVDLNYSIGWYLRSQPTDVSIPDNPFFADLDSEKSNDDGAPEIFYRHPDNAGWSGRVEKFQEELLKRCGLDLNGASLNNSTTDSRTLIIVDTHYLQPPFYGPAPVDILLENDQRSVRMKKNFLKMKDDVFKQSKLDVLVLCKLKTETTEIQNGSFTKHIVQENQQSYFFPTIEISDAKIVAWDMIKVNQSKHMLAEDNYDLVTEIRANFVGMHRIIDEFKIIQSQIESKRKYFGDSNTKVHPGHFVFVGNPGTGKTIIAQMFAKYLYSVDVLECDEYCSKNACHLHGYGYTGGATIAIKQFLNECLGKVIFIDCAHHFVDDMSFANEVADTLVSFLENHGYDCIVILAGYKEPISRFLESNQGLKNRFTNWIQFDDYAEDEFVDIFKKMLNRWEVRNEKPISFVLSDNEEFIEQLRMIFRAIKDARGTDFGNATIIRNIANKTVSNLYIRIGEDHDLPEEDYRKITLQDLPSLSDICRAY